MLDVRWSHLKKVLVDAGWVWRDNTLYAPHETLWFQTCSDNPDFALFRDRMTDATDAPDVTEVNLCVDIDQAALHADLVSLVAALDEVLGN